MAAIEFTSIVKSFGSATPVVKDVSLKVNDGEFVVLVGPSGCGKSTLLRMAAGLETITSGTISIDGRVVNNLAPRHRDVAMVFQDYALYPHKTVRDNLAFGLRMRKVPEPQVAQKVAHAAQMLHMEALLDRLPGQLSGGQRQRVAIGRAIVREPKVFFFDEPLSNLDAQLRGEMRVEIKRLQRELKATVVYVTHDQVEAMTMADRIAVLNGGRLMQYGAPKDIYQHPQALFVAQFMGAPPMATFALTRRGDAWCYPDGTPCQAPALLQRLPNTQAASLTVGLRPEHVLVAAPPLPHTNPLLALPATLKVLEPLGAETLATFAVHGATLVAKAPQHYDAPVGTVTTLYAQAQGLRFFDAVSGASLA
jgi:multiple sugar transport system ATP-binding protein